jgi:hypothetical protein
MRFSSTAPGAIPRPEEYRIRDDSTERNRRSGNRLRSRSHSDVNGMPRLGTFRTPANHFSAALLYPRHLTLLDLAADRLSRTLIEGVLHRCDRRCQELGNARGSYRRCSWEQDGRNAFRSFECRRARVARR